MDNTTNQPETVGQQEPLIDILYKDDYRVKSYIAQMLAGAVQSVKKQSTSSTGSFFDAIAPAARKLYDSGDNAYTITPFLIYRELSR